MSRARRPGNVWIRAGLLHPVLFVAPLVGLALVLGFYGWIVAAAIACHGGYECPF